MTTLPSKYCLYDKCGREITKDQHCAETPDQFAKRYNSGYCRKKCERLHSPKPPPQGESRPRPTLSLISAEYGRSEGVAQVKEVPVVDEGYRRFVRSFPCLVPGCENEPVFHHQNMEGHGGKGALCSDYRGLPLCPAHHTNGGMERLPFSYHGMGKVTGWKFWAVYGIDVESNIHNLNRLWLESGRKFKA